MSGNIFTKPSKTFKENLEAPNMIVAFLIVLIVSIVFGSIFYLGTQGNLIVTLIVIATSIIQWLVLSVIYYIFEFMFSDKKRAQIKTNFPGIITATGSLWLMMLVLQIFLGIALIGGIITAIAGLVAMIILVLILVNSFILMKVILDSSNTRVFIAWILAIAVYLLLLTIASILTQILI
jgi:hypothetical protein